MKFRFHSPSDCIEINSQQLIKFMLVFFVSRDIINNMQWKKYCKSYEIKFASETFQRLQKDGKVLVLATPKKTLNNPNPFNNPEKEV